MLINPIVLIAATAIVLCVLIFCIINKPGKPVFTGVSIGMLILFLIFTGIINMSLTSSAGDPGTANFVNAVVEFLTAQHNPTTVQLEQTFSIFACIDAGFVIITVISMFVEVRRIFSIANNK